ncbi:MAG: response regulator [Oscillospiraceae bacterium]|jgi:DNA-binding response OmpR family regulator|nr:response regulator [Oscillospiraceae bacterium]
MKKIVLVDDNPAILSTCKKTLKDLYEVFPAPSAEKMFEILEHVTPELILLDVEMSGMNGYDAMRKLQESDEYRDIPVIFLSAMDDAESEMEGLDLGAVDYIHKPFVSALLIKRIETHLAVIDGKKEMRALNESITALLTPSGGEAKPGIEADEQAIKALMSRDDILLRMGHEIRTPLNTVMAMIESAIQSDSIADIKHRLGRADIASRLIKEIIDDILDVPSKEG